MYTKHFNTLPKPVTMGSIKRKHRSEESEKRIKKSFCCIKKSTKMMSSSSSAVDINNITTIRAASAARKQKLKILILIALVSITFALTWLPAHFIRIWKVAFNSSFPYNDTMYLIKVFSHTLTYTNSVLNPFFYVFIGAKFRSHIYSEFNFFCCNPSDVNRAQNREVNRFNNVKVNLGSNSSTKVTHSKKRHNGNQHASSYI